MNFDKSFYLSQGMSYRIKPKKQISWSAMYPNNIEKPFIQVRYYTHRPDVLSQLFYDKLCDWDFVSLDKNKSVIKFWFNKKNRRT